MFALCLIILGLLLIAIDALACETGGAFTYRHNSDPQRSSREELYVFDGLGLSALIHRCDLPVFVELDVHQQMNSWAVDYGDWRVDFKIGIQIW